MDEYTSGATQSKLVSRLRFGRDRMLHIASQIEISPIPKHLECPAAKRAIEVGLMAGLAGCIPAWHSEAKTSAPTNESSSWRERTDE